MKECIENGSNLGSNDANFLIIGHSFATCSKGKPIVVAFFLSQANQMYLD
jgi:hypothetical protein